MTLIISTSSRLETVRSKNRRSKYQAQITSEEFGSVSNSVWQQRGYVIRNVGRGNRVTDLYGPPANLPIASHHEICTAYNAKCYNIKFSMSYANMILIRTM